MVTLKYAVRNEPFRGAFGLNLFGGPAKRQRLGLGADIGKQHVMVPADRIERLIKGNEVARDEPGPLMNQVVKRMLAVRSRFTPIDWACRPRDSLPIDCDLLPASVHRQLLEVGGEPLEILLIRQDSYCLRAKEIVVPERQKPHKYGQIVLEGFITEVFIHLMQPA